MRIKKIKIKDYKAFYGKHTVEPNGKNLFVYGENGSGKSSFYYASKDFFQSFSEDLNYDCIFRACCATRNRYNFMAKFIH